MSHELGTGQCGTGPGRTWQHRTAPHRNSKYHSGITRPAQQVAGAHAGRAGPVGAERRSQWSQPNMAQLHFTTRPVFTREPSPSASTTPDTIPDPTPHDPSRPPPHPNTTRRTSLPSDSVRRRLLHTCTARPQSDRSPTAVRPQSNRSPTAVRAQSDINPTSVRPQSDHKPTQAQLR